MTRLEQRPAPANTPSELRYLALAALVESPLNPRKHFDATKLRELTDSIAKVGVLTPLVVRPSPGDRFEIGAGHRRFRAAKDAGLSNVPCRVLPLDDTAFLELLVTENGQRAGQGPPPSCRVLVQVLHDKWRGPREFPGLAKAVGVDVAKILDQVAPEPKAEPAKPAPKQAAKPKAKKR